MQQGPPHDLPPPLLLAAQDLINLVREERDSTAKELRELAHSSRSQRSPMQLDFEGALSSRLNHKKDKGVFVDMRILSLGM